MRGVSGHLMKVCAALTMVSNAEPPFDSKQLMLI